MAILARSPKTRIFWKRAKGVQGKFFKNRPKRCPRWKNRQALWRKCHYPLISMHLKCKDWKWFWRKKRLRTVPEMAKLWQFSQGYLKPAFSVKVQTWDQKKFLKNRPKSSPSLKGPKAHWCKWHYLLISMHLKFKDWKRFTRKQRLQKCPNGQLMAILARSPKTRIF